MTLEGAVVRQVKAGTVALPPYPDAAMKVGQLLALPDWSVQALVDVLKNDAVLAGTLLRLANSAAHARGGVVTELSVAVVRLGAEELRSLALASGVGQLASVRGPLASLRRRAWHEAIVCARICEELACVARASREESFLAGLLHDIGRLLAIGCFEAELAAHPAEPARTEEAWWALVEQFHLELGLVLAAQWQLPELFERVIAEHHEMRGDAGALVQRVKAADTIVGLMQAQVHLTAAELQLHVGLSTTEAEWVGSRLPQIPDFVMALAPPPVGADAASKVAAAPAAAPPRIPASSRVEVLGASRGPLSCVVVGAARNELIVSSPEPLRENLLVKVVFDRLEFSARVKACVGQLASTATLAPFALPIEMFKKWKAFVEAAPRAVPA